MIAKANVTIDTFLGEGIENASESGADRAVGAGEVCSQFMTSVANAFVNSSSCATDTQNAGVEFAQGRL